MNDKYVREIGRITDGQGRQVVIGVDGGLVALRTFGTHEGPVVLEQPEAEELGQLYVRACWEAARQDGAP